MKTRLIATAVFLGMIVGASPVWADRVGISISTGGRDAHPAHYRHHHRRPARHHVAAPGTVVVYRESYRRPHRHRRHLGPPPGARGHRPERYRSLHSRHGFGFYLQIPLSTSSCGGREVFRHRDCCP